jgi:serine/threonine protein kinase
MSDRVENNERDEFEDILVFNKYMTKRKLGEGSFGKVYSGVNTLNDEKVAIKLVRLNNNKLALGE